MDGSTVVDGHELYARVEEHALRHPGVTRSTMMGLPCLRLDGRFFASLDRRTGELIVKLPRHRIAELTESGRGTPFAPNGRVFREWIAIGELDEALWSGLVAEAREFASNG